MFEGSDDQQKHIMSMHFECQRLKSFSKWPFNSECKCTPEKMAEAGFFHCPTDQEPDLVKCFACHKELDGWEPEDDPWLEHRSHSGHCPFLQLPNPKEMSVSELTKLVVQRLDLEVRKIADRQIKEFEEHCKEARAQFDALL